MNAPRKYAVTATVKLVFLIEPGEEGGDYPGQFETDEAVQTALNDVCRPALLSDRVRQALEDQQGRVPDVHLDYSEVTLVPQEG